MPEATEAPPFDFSKPSSPFDPQAGRSLAADAAPVADAAPAANAPAFDFNAPSEPYEAPLSEAAQRASIGPAPDRSAISRGMESAKRAVRESLSGLLGPTERELYGLMDRTGYTGELDEFVEDALRDKLDEDVKRKVTGLFGGGKWAKHVKGWLGVNYTSTAEELAELGIENPTYLAEKAVGVKAGVENTAAGLFDFMMSPAGLPTLGFGAIGKGAQALVAKVFTVDMLSKSPEMVKKFVKAAKEGDAQGQTEAVLQGLMTAGVSYHGIKGTKGQLQRLKTRRPVPRTKDASSVQLREYKTIAKMLDERGPALPPDQLTLPRSDAPGGGRVVLDRPIRPGGAVKDLRKQQAYPIILEPGGKKLRKGQKAPPVEGEKVGTLVTDVDGNPLIIRQPTPVKRATKPAVIKTMDLPAAKPPPLPQGGVVAEPQRGTVKLEPEKGGTKPGILTEELREAEKLEDARRSRLTEEEPFDPNSADIRNQVRAGELRLEDAVELLKQRRIERAAEAGLREGVPGTEGVRTPIDDYKSAVKFLMEEPTAPTTIASTEGRGAVRAEPEGGLLPQREGAFKTDTGQQRPTTVEGVPDWVTEELRAEARRAEADIRGTSQATPQTEAPVDAPIPEAARVIKGLPEPAEINMNFPINRHLFDEAGNIRPEPMNIARAQARRYFENAAEAERVAQTAISDLWEAGNLRGTKGRDIKRWANSFTLRNIKAQTREGGLVRKGSIELKEAREAELAEATRIEPSEQIVEGVTRRIRKMSKADRELFDSMTGLSEKSLTDIARERAGGTGTGKPRGYDQLRKRAHDVQYRVIKDLEKVGVRPEDLRKAIEAVESAERKGLSDVPVAEEARPDLIDRLLAKKTERFQGRTYSLGGALFTEARNLAIDAMVLAIRAGRVSKDILKAGIKAFNKHYKGAKLSPEMVDRAMTEMLDDAFVEYANTTARGAGAVGDSAIVPRVVMRRVPLDASVLDFGSGPEAIHSKLLRSRGYSDVTSYDFGRNKLEGQGDLRSMDKKDVVFASNVLNTQGHVPMLRDTIGDIVSAVKPDGVAYANYPTSPRIAKIPVATVEAALRERFGSVERIKEGNYKDPIFELRNPRANPAPGQVYFDPLLFKSVLEPLAKAGWTGVQALRAMTRTFGPRVGRAVGQAWDNLQIRAGRLADKIEKVEEPPVREVPDTSPRPLRVLEEEYHAKARADLEREIGIEAAIADRVANRVKPDPLLPKGDPAMNPIPPGDMAPEHVGVWKKLHRLHAVLQQAQGVSLPRTIKINQELGEAGVRLANSKLAAQPKAEHFIDRVFEHITSGLQKNKEKFQTVIVEDNLASLRQRHIAEGRPDLAEQVWRPLEAKENPFASAAEYETFVRSPEFTQALAKYKELWAAEIDPIFNAARRADPEVELPTRGLRFGARVNLVRADMVPGLDLFAGGANFLAPQGKGFRATTPFARRADGLSEVGYSLDPDVSIQSSFARQLEIANRNTFDQMMLDRGDAVLATSKNAPTNIKGEKAIPYDIGNRSFISRNSKGEVSSFTDTKKLWVRETIAPEYTAILEKTDMAWRESIWAKVPGLANKLALAGPTDAAIHSINILKSVAAAPLNAGNALVSTTAAVAGRSDALYAMGKVLAKSAVNSRLRRSQSEQWAKITEIGAGRGDHVIKGAKWHKKLTGLFATAMNAIDKQGRIFLDDVYTRMVKEGWVHDTAQGRREFINGHVGNYNTRTQGVLVRKAKGSGFSPFIVAGRTMNLVSARAALATPTVLRNAQTPAGRIVLRMNMATKIFGAGLAITALNQLITGLPTGRKGTGLGNIDLGYDDHNGNPVTLPIFSWLGLERGYRATGIKGLAESAKLGLSPTDALSKAGTDVVNAWSHPLAGPVIHTGAAAFGRSPSIGFSRGLDVPPGDSPIIAGAMNALWHSSPPLRSIHAYMLPGGDLMQAAKQILPGYTPRRGLKDEMVEALPEIIYGKQTQEYIDHVIRRARPADGEARMEVLRDAFANLDRRGRKDLLTGILFRKLTIPKEGIKELLAIPLPDSPRDEPLQRTMPRF